MSDVQMPAGRQSMKDYGRGKRKLSHRGNWWRITVLLLLGALTFIPFIITIVISFKDINQFTHQPFLITLPLHFKNYLTAFEATYRYLANSLYVSAMAVIFTLICACLSAYTFARFDFVGKAVLFYFMLALLMIPTILSLVTRFIMVRNFGLLNSHWALIIPYVSGGQIFMMFVAKTFFEGLPEELFESARLEGAKELRILWSIVLPMSRPIIWTLTILNVHGNWNNILWPMITLSKRIMYPITVGLLYFRTQYFVDRGPMMAGYIIASVPMIILFMIASRQFVEGLSSGALKM